jgi:hypothetical protein
MAIKKLNNKKNIYLLLGLGIIGFVVYKKWAESKKTNQSDNKDTGSGVGFDPIALAKEDPEFKAYVIELQTKLNNAIKKMMPPVGTTPQPSYYPLKIDGLIGKNTLAAVELVFGADVLPLVEKKSVIWLVENFK